MALKAGGPVPLDYWAVVMCERFGWPLEYFEALDVREMHKIIAVWSGIEKATSKGKR